MNIISEKILLLGFGDIAHRLAIRLSAHKHPLTAVRRSPIASPLATTVAADCTDISQLLPIVASGFDVIVITMTPDSYSDAGYKKAYVDSMQTLLQALQQTQMAPRLILFVSSSSVYGQDAGEWVDENSETQPQRYNGQRVLEAENLLRDSGYAHCVVRFSGIYGPGRERMISQLLKGSCVASEPIIYSNRIHADDCAGVLHHLIHYSQHQSIDSVYLATDNAPEPLWEVQQWLREALRKRGYDVPMMAYQASSRASRRCRNARLLETGYVFSYPDFRQGYAAILDELQSL
ncbi:SDR family oxidoreductase [Marinicella sp. W31]|uniref:SDR family oxidoreductase n=1 Tax=Marinicella sp. W31 TaxID=3023713 RepID=UPI003756ACCA